MFTLDLDMVALNQRARHLGHGSYGSKDIVQTLTAVPEPLKWW